MTIFMCHICGFPDLEEAPYGPLGNSASHDICPCCGCEYGYNDVTEKGRKNHLEKWISSGGKWFDEGLRPKDWDMKNQSGISVASGLYIIHIDVPEVGEKILKWFGVMRPLDLQSY